MIPKYRIIFCALLFLSRFPPLNSWALDPVSVSEISDSHTSVIEGQVRTAELDPELIQSTHQFPPLSEEKLATGDLDGDGHTDLFSLPKEGQEFVSILRSPLNGPWWEKVYGFDSRCNWNNVWAFQDRLKKTKFLAPKNGEASLCLAEILAVKEKTTSLHISTLSLPSGRDGKALIHPQGRVLSSATGAESVTAVLVRGSDRNQLHMWKIDGDQITFPLPDLGGENEEILALADIEGDGTIEILQDVYPVGVRRRSQVSDYHFGDKKSWIRIDRSQDSSPPKLLPADLNGDGRTDFIVFQRGVGANLLVFSGEITGFERELSELKLGFDNAENYHIADLDNDGRNELLIADAQRGYLELWQARLGKPVSGARVQLQSGERTETDLSGSFRFEKVPVGTQRILVQFPSGRTAKRSVETHAMKTERITLLDDSVIDDKSLRVQAIGLNGYYEGPAICTGYNPELFDWGEKYGALVRGSCPTGHALFSAEVYKSAQPYLQGVASSRAENSFTKGFCCKLPSSDILSERTISAPDRCPEGSIATGLASDKNSPDKVYLICTDINLRRYQLASETPGVYWGIDAGMLHQSPRVHRSAIPPALREGVGRSSYKTWYYDGCIGQPWGSLLVGKGINRCDGFGFRQLQYRGVPGDPAHGTPVIMFPPCLRVKNPFDPLSACITLGTSR